MENVNSYKGKFKRFLMRCCIYSIVLLWPISKIGNIQHNSEEYKERLLENFRLFRLHRKFFQDLAQDPSLLLLIVSLCEIIFGILGIFGLFIGNFISMILFFFTNFIYFNPFVLPSRITFFKTKIEIILNIGIFTTLCLITFYPYEIAEDKVIDESEISLEESLAQKEEMNKSMPVKKSKKKKS